MTVWNNSLMNTHYETLNGPSEICPELGWPCSVQIEGPNIEVQYEKEGMSHTYFGNEETPPGHFKLRHSAGIGAATLFRPSEESTFLFGTWEADTERGLWRVKLRADEPA
ncbi:MAG TPA: hypothetical protein VGM98_05270 [Schlesneria sp.]|jgi:hypothetical protein